MWSRLRGTPPDVAAKVDAVVVGSGPNGLSAAVALCSFGFSVRLVEASPQLGGGLRTVPSQDEGFLVDECSAIHPMGVLSPFFRSLRLEEHGLSWCTGPLSVAHPLDDGPAALLGTNFERLSDCLGARDARIWKDMFAPLARSGGELLADLMGPLSLMPRAPLAALRFGWLARRSATSLARSKFEGDAAQALFAGLAGHSILPLEMPLTAAFGMIFGVTAAMTDWPCARGGSQAIADALASKLKSLGGEIEVSRRITSLAELDDAKVVLFDTSPHALISIAGKWLPPRYLRALQGYNYGPGTFKVDWTLAGSIPWSDPQVRNASTVHVGGKLEEIATSERAAWLGDDPASPYLILCQQSEMDSTRAPAGCHTGYAYCHVPHGYDQDVSNLIEEQVERFAPGFRDLIRSRKITAPSDFERLNPNYIGGAVTGGSATLGQLFTRPVARLNPYSTPNPRVFLCSASTPPGGGVHGMCGFYAALSAAKRLGKRVDKNRFLAVNDVPLLPPPSAD